MVAAVPHATDPGLLSALGRLSRSLIGHARMRVQLLGLELEQEKQRIFVALLATLFAYLFLSVTLMLVALAVIVHFWDTPDRMTSVIWMAVISALITVGSALYAMQRISRPSTLFHASLAELAEDEEALIKHPVEVAPEFQHDEL
jgi:uncharacterized membrane protein YqjE